MSIFKQNKQNKQQCRGILRTFICSSKDEDCMLVYKHNTEGYESKKVAKIYRSRLRYGRIFRISIKTS
jgi:hypothetical protein